MAALVFLYLPYTLLFLLGQWLYKCQPRPVIHFMVKMKPFFDAHFGCLKEKHGYWFGALLLVRAFILLLSTLIPVSNMKVITYSVSVTALALISFQTLYPPYSIATVSKYETIFFINLAGLGLTTFYTTIARSQTVATYVSIAIAFSQFLGLLTFKVCKKTQRKNVAVESIYGMAVQFQEEKC